MIVSNYYSNLYKGDIMIEIKTDMVYEFDQFFTKESVAIDCIKKVKDIYSLSNFDIIIEPSAGSGSFFKNLPKNKTIGIEIDEALCKGNLKYINKSFFDYTTSNEKCILVIGNPPFGTQNKLSVSFFNHAAKFAHVIAFIVPKTWNKQSIHNRLDKNFILIKSIDLQEDCFFGVKETSVKCCFQIWERSDSKRIKPEKKLSHKDWDFVNYINNNDVLSPPVNADFCLLAYGSKPGQVSDDLYRWRPKSVHFIKSNISKQILIDRFSDLDYSCANDSARQSSLCKSDLVRLYSEKFGE